jgi:nucleotide-binding universal stress UspA family protein
MSTILVPLDGSPLAEQALPHACRLARASGSALHLVRAALPVADPDAGTTSRSSVQHAETYLGNVRDRLRTEGYAVTISSLYSDPVPGILLAARVNGASLIVMSTHGRTGLRRMVLGSVTERLVQDCHLPVLVVNNDSCSVAPEGRYQHILVPLDGSICAEAALTTITAMQLEHDAHVLLLRSVPPLAGAAGGYASGAYVQPDLLDEDQQRLEAGQYLDLIAARYLHGQRFQTRVVAEYAAKAILDAIAESQVDLVVLATHARHGIDRFAHTSVAGHVLHHTGTPVLVVHGTDTDAESPPLRAEPSREERFSDDCLFV